MLDNTNINKHKRFVSSKNKRTIQQVNAFTANIMRKRRFNI